MNAARWSQFYERICSDLSIDPDADSRSAKLLSGILGEGSTLKLLDPFAGKNALVFGNGPELEAAITSLGEAGTSIVADSALPVYMKEKGAPDIVVTDLDGDLNYLARAHNDGSLMVIHAHGDNTNLIRDFGTYFVGNSIGTTQGIPEYNVYNFYGFTDGDRSAYLAHYLGAPRITLVGFDFDNVTGKPGSSMDRKRKKLKWARILLEELARERNTSLGNGVFIPL